MFEIIIASISLVIILISLVALYTYIEREINKASIDKEKSKQPETTTPVIHVSAPVDPRIDELSKVIQQMPQKVLESITSSSNQHKGGLGTKYMRSNMLGDDYDPDNMNDHSNSTAGLRGRY